MRTVEVKLIADNEKDLEEKVKNYMGSYHPIGYGTYVRNRYFDVDNNLHVAVISRQNSCD